MIETEVAWQPRRDQPIGKFILGRALPHVLIVSYLLYFLTQAISTIHQWLWLFIPLYFGFTLGHSLSAIQRMIVRTVVEASDIAGFAVEKVVIELFPLPEVKFVVAAVDAPLGMDASRIMRAIEDLNRQMRRAAPASDDLRPRAGDDPAQRRSERTAAR